jgi:hypothetical protein
MAIPVAPPPPRLPRSSIGVPSFFHRKASPTESPTLVAEPVTYPWSFTAKGEAMVPPKPSGILVMGVPSPDDTKPYAPVVLSDASPITSPNALRARAWL